MSEMKTIMFPGDLEPRKVSDAKARELIGNLDELETTKRSNLVEAINEVLQYGGNSGGGVNLTGYATEQYVKEYAQPKGSYLTQHQSLEHLLPRSDLGQAVNNALIQATNDWIASKTWVTTQVKDAIKASWEASY